MREQAPHAAPGRVIDRHMHRPAWSAWLRAEPFVATATANKPLFLRPTELADGLALKELRYDLGRAPPARTWPIRPVNGVLPLDRFPRSRAALPGMGFGWPI